METAIIILIVLAILAAAFWYLGKKGKKQMEEQQEMINKHKTTIPIFVIEKKMARLSEGNFPKTVVEQVPKLQRRKKMPLVKAKVGNQIITFICDKKIFEKIPEKRMIKAEAAGIYIVGFKNK